MKRSVYVAGFERGVRPIGLWSMSMTLSKHVDAVDAVVIARLRPHLVEPVRERLVEDLVDEGGLARAGDAGHGDEAPDREVDVDALEVVHRRAAHREPAALVVVAPRRDEDAPLAAQELHR